MQQLDIFDDGRDRMLVNDLASAVAGDRLGAARHALVALAAEFPDEPLCGPAQRLIDALQARQTAAFADSEAALAARKVLDAQLMPEAVALLGADDARPWRTARLRELAARASRLPWDADQPQAHAAAFLVAAGAWDEARDAVHGIASWRQLPQTLGWAAEAVWRRDGADAGWPLLAELAWLAPARAGALVATLADPRLSRLAARFEADLDGENLRWLPAWVLIEQPLLATPLAVAQPRHDGPAEQAFKLLLALLRLERQGRHHELVDHRRRLRGLHPALFACYMRTR